MGKSHTDCGQNRDSAEMDQPHPENVPMEYQLKHRLTGAVIILLAGVLIIPLILQEPDRRSDSDRTAQYGEISEDDASSGLADIGQSLLDSDQPESTTTTSMEQGSKPALLSADEPEAGSGSEAAGQEPETRLVMDLRNEEAKSGTATASATGQGDKEVVAKPALEADTTEASGWTVRVGTFVDAKNARQVMEELSRHDYAPRATEVTTSAGEATRVWLGPYSDQAKARNVARKLKDITKEEGYVTKQ